MRWRRRRLQKLAMTSDEKYGHQDKSFDQLQHRLGRVGILDSFSCTMTSFQRERCILVYLRS